MKLKIKEICVKCGAKCCFLGGPTITKKERDKIFKLGFKNVFICQGKFYDLKAKNDRCPFLENNLCSVQSVKPLVCKIWPVFPIFRGNKRKLIILECPLTKRLSKKDVKKLKILAKRVSRELYKTNTTGLSIRNKKKLNEFGWNKRHLSGSQ
jgi:Fe-S-cluster containining protein